MRNFRDSVELTAALAQAAGSGRSLVIDFMGANCAPCRKLEPVLEELEGEFREQVEVLKVDIEKHPEVAQRFGVRSVPTLIALCGAEVRGQLVGFSNRRRVRELFMVLAKEA